MSSFRGEADWSMISVACASITGVLATGLAVGFIVLMFWSTK